MTTLYQTIVIDPPWRYATSLPGFGKRRGDGTWERPGSVVPYPTLTVAEIAALPIGNLAAKDAHLYLWTTNHHLPTAFGIARAWGFTYSTALVWAKTPRGMSGQPAWNVCTEFVLFCRRGSLPALTRQGRNWFAWQRGKHSAKPPEFLTMVEETSPGPRVEVFARVRRPGWDSIGQEIDGRDVRDVLRHLDGVAVAGRETA